MEYFNQAAEFKNRIPPPDVVLANECLWPHRKTCIPGVISASFVVQGGVPGFGFHGTLYHGHSGGPVLALDEDGVAKVAAIGILMFRHEKKP